MSTPQPSATESFLTVDEVAERIRFSPRTIKNQLNGTVFKEGEHYIRAFGRRKLLYRWDKVNDALCRPSEEKLPPSS